MRFLRVLLTIFLLHPCIVYSQEYSYAHYGINDGLAGSAVYCIGQDKDGFMWFGTETGLSRFDGTHFKNFTVADGLPDLEILQLFGDSVGRMWMAPYRNAVCYYYKGKIHNPQNDSLLGSVRLRSNIEGISQDASGNILLVERSALHVITRTGKAMEYDSLGGQAVRNCCAAGRSRSGNFLAQINDMIIEFTYDGFVRRVTPIHFYNYSSNFIVMNPWWSVWRDSVKATVMNFNTGKRTSMAFRWINSVHNSYTLIDDSLLYISQTINCREINLRTGTETRLLPGKNVSRVFRDMDGSLWLATLSEGVYRQNSKGARTIALRCPDGYQCVPYSICRVGNQLWIGTDYQLLFRLSPPNYVLKMVDYLDRGKARLLFLDTVGRKYVIWGSDQSLEERYANGKYFRKYGYVVKSICTLDDHRWLIGLNNGVFGFDPKKFKFTDTFTHERASVVFGLKDTIYYGTHNGLYRVIRGQVEFLGAKFALLKQRITTIVHSSDGTLWMASPNFDGLIGYRNDSIIAHITQEQGLSSNLCRCLLVHDQGLWVGTDKGLNRIALNRPDYPVTDHITNDAQGIDFINCLYADGHTIYAGTSTGIFFFDERQMINNDPCRLHLLGIFNGGKDRLDDSADLELAYKDKAIRFDYTGISYRSAGEVHYRYRLEGLDTTWRETDQTSLEYPALPAGHYRFQLQAINKFGTRSVLLLVPFIVKAAWWETRWFEALMLIAAVLIVWTFVSMRIRTIRRQQREKEELLKGRAEMENRALQAQMNPHFIFNCLNSIQQFVFDGDMLATNEFITGFARLIRFTLHNSSHSFISVQDEVEYLTTYLSLEKMRFKEKLDYHIFIDPALDKEKTLLPPMMIQPYVENAMRHGLRHKTKGGGHIWITIQLEEGRLFVIVEDNGIGRKKAAEYKTSEHIEYQSKGMTLTSDRMKAIGAIYGDTILVKVEDRMNDHSIPDGTKVSIRLPAFHAQA